MKKSLAIVVVLAMAATANAGVTTGWTDMGTHAAGGADYRVWDLITEVGSDWTNARLDLLLTSGTLFQQPLASLGSDVEPNPALFPAFADVEWDTYVSTPGGWVTPVSFAGSAPYMSDTSMTVSWFDSAVGTSGTYKIARASLSPNANGTITGTSYDFDTRGFGVDFAYPIVDGEIIPEPATLVLLGLGGIGALLRKRR